KQLASILEALVRNAVCEITRLYESSFADLQSVLAQSEREKASLRARLEQAERRAPGGNSFDLPKSLYLNVTEGDTEEFPCLLESKNVSSLNEEPRAKSPVAPEAPAVPSVRRGRPSCGERLSSAKRARPSPEVDSTCDSMAVEAKEEHFYDGQSGTGYLAWRLKTVQRKSVPRSRGLQKSSVSRGPDFERQTQLSAQLQGESCEQAVSDLADCTDREQVFLKMRETFHYRRQLVHDPQRNSTVLSTFPRLLDTKGLALLSGAATHMEESLVKRHPSVAALLRQTKRKKK
ncbi:hypothetical protein Z043_107781, partial [Scleropages formosus]